MTFIWEFPGSNLAWVNAYPEWWFCGFLCASRRILK